jgi:hypothetical protein
MERKVRKKVFMQTPPGTDYAAEDWSVKIGDFAALHAPFSNFDFVAIILHNYSLVFPFSVIDFDDTLLYNIGIPSTNKEAIPCNNIRCSAT